eukprot:CAMPEP_0170498320 /NCGR_PEP_ID=MMETSP0208-20121228/27453_1 /TAXON_ID=197538 /ORGANISM="Strombidium inclinatum, Strain S3" /LENGTH=55 /DNA_ID=CAMNT_0010775455 /DNA_START=89 /DNA_END=253 /DNA_ORIENTATION=-
MELNKAFGIKPSEVRKPPPWTSAMKLPQLSKNPKDILTLKIDHKAKKVIEESKKE